MGIKCVKYYYREKTTSYTKDTCQVSFPLSFVQHLKAFGSLHCWSLPDFSVLEILAVAVNVSNVEYIIH